MAEMTAEQYPARLNIDYPEELSRLTTAFRLILIIPIFFILSALSGGGNRMVRTDGGEWVETTSMGVAGGLFIVTLLVILFRQRYPRWWFDFQLQLTRFSVRVFTYLLLMTDQYPSTEDEQSVSLDLDYPNVEEDLNRWLPLVKWLLAIPHYLVLIVLGFLAFFAVIFAWFAILFTGRYPRGLFNFVLGVGRWGLRVQAYMLLLITDRYPPFSLDP